MRWLLEIFTQLEKTYTTAGRDGRDKFQVCILLAIWQNHLKTIIDDNFIIPTFQKITNRSSLTARQI